MLWFAAGVNEALLSIRETRHSLAGPEPVGHLPLDFDADPRFRPLVLSGIRSTGH